MRKLLLVAGFLGLSVFWACHLNEAAVEDRFDLVGDTSWTACDNVIVELLNKDKQVIDTLFNGPLTSTDQLKSLSAGKYDGTKATIHVFGTKAGGVCFDETRSFEGNGDKVVVDTISKPNAAPVSVGTEPETITMPLGSAGVAVVAFIKPTYADQSVDWSLAGDGIVSLTLPTGGNGTQVKVNPEMVGSTDITVRSRKDNTKSAKLRVTVTAPNGNVVTVNHDSIVVYLGGRSESLKATVSPSGSDQRVEWRSLNPAVAAIDTAGAVTGVSVGETYVQAKSIANGVFVATHVDVRRDAPKLTVASKTGAPVNTAITFSPHASQEYGSIVMYKWDLDGDGAYDDSTHDTFPGTQVDLPAQTATYKKEGTVTARFYVRDTEGNETITGVPLDIGNQAPEVLAISHDTAVSILDSVPFKATVHDVDGKVAWLGWDYENDGVFDDSTAPNDTLAKIATYRKYPDAGIYRAILKAKDETGKVRLDTVLVKVDLDRPVASAGNDTTVTVGATVLVHVGGSDKYGSIVTREVKLPGTDTTIHPLSKGKTDTSFTASTTPGTYMVYVRVTDDDGLRNVDSMVVTVVLSANADLSNLTFSAGALDPAFKGNISNFTAHVAFPDSMVTVTPTAKDADAKITVNAKSVASGTASEAVKLTVGSNNKVFEIIVTAADGTQHIYYVSVARDPSANASLSKLDVTGFTLKPAFASGVLDYADTVASSVASVTLKPTLAVLTSSLTVNDSGMASGTATYPMPLAIGENIYKIVVTSQSGLIKTTYTVKVIRKAQFFLFRSLDGKAGTQIDSTESLPNALITLTTTPVTGYRFVKWTLLEGTAVITDTASIPTTITLNSVKVKAQANFVLNTYVIKASGNVGGSIAPSGDVTVTHGADQAFTITALPGYRLRGLAADGANGLPAMVGAVYTFKGVVAAHTIAADFVKQETLTATSGAGGSVTPATIVADNGSDTAFTVSGNPNYTLVSLMDNGVDKKANVGAKGRYPIHVDGGHTVAATWIQGITMKGVAGTGGYITPDSTVVYEGSDLTYTITVSPGYKFLKLLDNGVDSTVWVSGNLYKIAKVSAPHTVTVTFQKLWTVTVATFGAGTGKVDPAAGPTLVEAGKDLTVKYEAGLNSRVDSVLLDGVKQKLTGSLNLPAVSADHAVNVWFGKTYHIDVTWVGNGSVTPGTEEYEAGKDASFTLTPLSSLYHVDSIKVDGAVQAITSPFTIPAVNAAHTLWVHFVRTFNVASGVQWGLGGITPATATVDSLGSKVFNLTAGDHHRLWRVYDEGKLMQEDSTKSTYTATGIITDRLNIKVWFYRKYDLTIKAGGVVGGKISFSSATLLDSASMPEITITPDAGYHIESITDNGNPVTGSGDPYVSQLISLKPIKSSHEYFATFKRYYTLTADSKDVATGTISPASINVDEGGSAQFTITPGANYHLSTLVDNQHGIWPTGLYSVSNITANHKIIASFSSGKVGTIKLGYTVPAVPPRSTTITSTVPELCLVASNGAEHCEKGGYSMNVDVGEVLEIWAYSDYVTVSDCSGIVCQTKDKSFTQWNVLNADGKVVFTTEKNPWVDFKVDNSYNLQVVYDTDGIVK